MAITAHGKNGTAGSTAKQHSVHDLLLNVDKSVRIPPSPPGQPMSVAEEYLAFWTNDKMYHARFQDPATVAMFASKGYKNLTTQFTALPPAQQSFAYQNLTRHQAVARTKVAFNKYSGPYCAGVAKDESMLAGLAMMNLVNGGIFWPNTPIYGIFDNSAGYLFGQNQIVGQLEIWQERRKDITCVNDLHPTCKCELPIRYTVGTMRRGVVGSVPPQPRASAAQRVVFLFLVHLPRILSPNTHNHAHSPLHSPLHLPPHSHTLTHHLPSPDTRTDRNCLSKEGDTAPFAPLGLTKDQFFANLNCDKIAEGDYNMMTSVESLFCFDKSRSAFHASYDMGVYALPLKTQLCRMSAHQQLPWIDHKAKALSFNVILYNGNLDLYTKVQVYFQIALGGNMEKRLNIDSIKIRNNYSTSKDYLRLVLELIFVAGVAFFFYVAVVQARKDGWDAYLADGGWVNFLGTGFYVINILIWIIICVQNSKFRAPDAPTLTQSTTEIRMLESQFDSLVFLNTAYSLSNQASIFLNMIRVIIFFQFHDRLSIVTKTLGACAADLGHFLILFITLLVLFTYMGFKVLGHQVRDFRTMGWSLQTLCAMALGELDYDSIYVVAPVTGTIFFWTYLLVMTLLLMNVFLAIIVEGFIDAKKRVMNNCESIFSTISAAAQSEAIAWRCGKEPDKTSDDDVEGGARAMAASLEANALPGDGSRALAQTLKRVRLANAHRDSIMKIVQKVTVKAKEGEEERSLDVIHQKLDEILQDEASVAAGESAPAAAPPSRPIAVPPGMSKQKADMLRFTVTRLQRQVEQIFTVAHSLLPPEGAQ